MQKTCLNGWGWWSQISRACRSDWLGLKGAATGSVRAKHHGVDEARQPRCKQQRPLPIPVAGLGELFISPRLPWEGALN